MNSIEVIVKNMIMESNHDLFEAYISDPSILADVYINTKELYTLIKRNIIAEMEE